MLKADLHIHTTASDGKLTPTELISHVLKTDLEAIAITDHDTIAGVAEAQKAAEGTPLRVIQGAEVSTLFEGRECHLLAYAFEDEGIMHDLLKNQKSRRVERARSIIGNLNRLGFDISYEEVRGEAGLATIGRPHIARVMIKKGFAADTQEVFLRFLGNNASAYHKINYPDLSEAIGMIHRAGGIAVLAHPGDTVNFIDLKKIKEFGIDGIECYHPSHNPAHQRRYLEYCSNYDLLSTGGSDFHGKVHDYHHLGVIHIPLDLDSPLLKPLETTPLDTTETY